MAERLAEDERLDGVAMTYCSTVFVQRESRATFGCAMETLSGSVALTQVRGHPPTSPDEVTVGERTLAEHDLDVGDTIVVTGGSGVATQLRIVGSVVAPDSVNPARSVVFTLPGLVKLHGVSDLDVLPLDQSIALKYPSGVDAEALESALETDYELFFSPEDAYPVVPQSLSQMERVRSTLFVLAAFLGLVGMIGLVHFMLLSAGQRRHDTAVLEALGFVRRQTQVVVAAQALTIAAIGVAVGLPLGVLVGRSVWIAAVDRIGLVSTPTVPWLVAALVVVIVIIGALVASVFPGWSAARRRPTDVLRTG